MNLLEIVEQAGVIGCGGAGFPTHIKWKAKAEYLIVNGVECEPLLDTDKYLMRNRAEDIICAIQEAAMLLEVNHAVIALKENYTEEISTLESAISARGASIALHKMKSFYPAGDEQVIVYEVTGKTVPCGGIPLDVGAVVSNVATMIAVYDAMQGKPLVEKYVTVAGQVRRPCIVKAPVGTPVSVCIEAAGGTLQGDNLLIFGGPMMGKEILSLSGREQTVGKTTSGILVLPKDGFMEKYKGETAFCAMKKKAATACIQCCYCTMLCPRHLLGHPLRPHRIMRAVAFSEDIDTLLQENEEVQNAALCSLCGVCTAYACPMGLMPSKINALLKDKLAEQGIRRKTKETTSPLSDREWRKVPMGKIGGRIGVLPYIEKGTKEVIQVEPEEIIVMLRQGPGRLPEPVIAVGDTVEKGALIAQISKGEMGANLHAGITGTVTEVSEVIRIRREK